MDRVRLYIGGRLADLGERSVIQFTYTAEDLANPTTAVTSYSRQLTLPATRANDAIFGALRRPESVGRPDGWKPAQRLPFRLLSGAGELLEAGYAQLARIESSGSLVQSYTVVLFGQLGTVFHLLTYGGADDERKLSLADLPFSQDIDFTITAGTVAAAWAALEGGTPGKWQTINFAPCYNGIPSANFDADTAIGNALDMGLQNHVRQESVDYYASNGLTLIDLGREYTELDTKDLRSYLQRPVLRLRSVFDAIRTYLGGKGVTLELDPSFFSDENPYYDKSWLTLPLLDTLTLEGGRAVTLPISFGDVDFSTVAASTNTVPPAMPLGSGPSTVKVRPDVYAYTDGGRLYLGDGTHRSALLVQAIAYNAVNAVIARSKIAVCQSSNDGTTISPATFTALGTLTGTTDDTLYDVTLLDGDFVDMPELTLEAQSPARIELAFEMVALAGSDPLTFYDADGAAHTAETPISFTGEGTGTTTAVAGTVTRSGATITKVLLLGGTHTPADYLLSYAQMFGLHFIYDRTTQTLRVLTRNTLYADTTVTDIADRIARPLGAITPVAFDARFYEFAQESEGEFVDYYATIYGERYGVHRVNTGWQFNADHKDMMDGNAFRAAAEVLERRKYFIDIAEGGNAIPAPFIDGGQKYTLWAGDGSDLELDVPCPTNAAVISYWDDVFRTYDATSKAQLHGDDNAPQGGEDVLLFFNGVQAAYTGLRLTDDTPEMASLNNNAACWLLTGGTAVATLPHFGRYYRNDAHVQQSWDMGTPLAVDIPGLEIDTDSEIYRRAWKAYLEDRYNDDVRVVRCRVDLSGFQIGPDLLRRFWHFDNSLWVLNAICDYDPTGGDVVECEFVKVLDADAYADGQDYDDFNPLVPYSIAATPTAANFPSTGGTVQITIFGDDNWTLVGLPAWLTASQLSGGIRGTYTSTVVTLSAASDNTAKSDVFRIQGGAGGRVTITATQEAASYTYALEAITGPSFPASGGTAALNIYGVTYLGGVQTDRKLLTSADGCTIAKTGSDPYDQLSVSGLTVIADNLDTNPRSPLSCAFRASWKGATADFTVTQAENAKHLTGTSTGHSAQITIGAYVNGGTAADPAGDTAALGVNGYDGTVYTYTWDSGATSTESPGGSWSGFTVAISGAGASINQDGDIEWADRAAVEGGVRYATITVYDDDGVTILAQATTAQKANSIVGKTIISATVNQSNYHVSGDTFGDPRAGEYCTLSVSCTYTATFSSGATATITDNDFPATYEIVSGTGLLLSQSGGVWYATWDANTNTQPRNVTVRARDVDSGDELNRIILTQKARVWVAIENVESPTSSPYVWQVLAEGGSHTFTVTSNSPLTLGVQYIATAVLTLISTYDGVYEYDLAVTMPQSADAARVGYVTLETYDDNYDGQINIEQPARYTTPNYVNITVGSGWQGILSELVVHTPAGDYVDTDVVVLDGVITIAQETILQALGISTTLVYRNFSQFAEMYGQISVDADFGGNTYSSATLVISGSTGDMGFTLAGVPTLTVKIWNASTGGSEIATLEMAAGVHSADIWVECNADAWAVGIPTNPGGWLTAAPMSGTGGVGAPRKKVTLSCAATNTDKTASVQVFDSPGGYANKYLTVTKRGDVSQIAYTVDDQTADASVAVTTSDGQGATGTAYDTPGWWMEIEIENQGVVGNEYTIAGGGVTLWQQTLEPGDTGRAVLTYANIDATGGSIEITET